MRWNSGFEAEAAIRGRPIQRLLLCVAAVIWTQSAPAQDPQCRLYKVQPSSLNISKEPRGDAVYIDALDNSDVVCVTREQNVGERNWASVDHKLLKPDQRKPVGGWANLALLQRLSDTDAATARSSKPIVIAAKSFGLLAGIAKLSEAVNGTSHCDRRNVYLRPAVRDRRQAPRAARAARVEAAKRKTEEEIQHNLGGSLRDQVQRDIATAGAFCFKTGSAELDKESTPAKRRRYRQPLPRNQDRGHRPYQFGPINLWRTSVAARFLRARPQFLSTWHCPAPGQRCLGACLLSQLPERRADYLKAWWHVVNWKTVSER